MKTLTQANHARNILLALRKLNPKAVENLLENQLDARSIFKGLNKQQKLTLCAMVNLNPSQVSIYIGDSRPRRRYNEIKWPENFIMASLVYSDSGFNDYIQQALNIVVDGNVMESFNDIIKSLS